MDRLRLLVRACLVILALAGFVSIYSSAASAQTETAPQVKTDAGPVVGRAEGSVNIFVGIPFAAPPIGPLRFRSPRPVTPWSAPRPATTPAARCMQDRPDATGGATGEDCLYLNVYAPANAPRALPVMVELYGGGFSIGSANDYDGSVIARKGGVIVVTLSYRLGPFGFLALPELSQEGGAGTSGNFGLQDQQAALRWVQRNIRAFGGDPDRVTIFGESAGGMSVCMHLQSPQSRGLFQRAISQSGFCGWRGRSVAAAFEKGAAYAAQMGCPIGPDALRCLRAKPPTELLRGTGQLGAFGPVQDGDVLPADQLQAFEAGDYARVPVMMGATRDEGSIFVVIQLGAATTQLSADGYRTLVEQRYGVAAPQLLSRYPAASFGSPAQALSAMMTDGDFVCPVQRATRLLAGRAPTFAYEFSYAGPISRSPLPAVPGLEYGVAHSADVGFVFGHGLIGDQPGPEFTSEEARVSDAMIGYWTRFAATGDPNGASASGERLPAWPRYDPAKDNVMLFARHPAVSHDTRARHHCAFWESSGLITERPFR